MKKLVCLPCALLLTAVSVHATVLFSDDFNSYGNGNLVGQGPWLQNGTSSATPVQVNNGKAVLGTSGQDVNAALSSPFSLVDGTTFYIGATLNVSSAQSAGDYFLHWSPATGSTTFLSRLEAKSTTGGFLLGYVETSGTGASLTWGTTVLNLNQDYRVVVAYSVVGGGLNDTAKVYVDPTDYALEANNTVYLSDAWTSALAETATLGAINLRQGTASSAPALSVDNLVVGTSFSDMQVVPEPSTVALFGLGLLGLNVARRRN